MKDQHPDYLRIPEIICKADQRNEGIVILSDNGLRPKQLQDQYEVVSKIGVHDGVPERIRIQFETTKNIYLYSWFVYRFYPIAQHHAYTCLELALRERFETELLIEDEKKLQQQKKKKKQKKQEFGPGLRRLLKYAVEKGYLKNENFEVWRNRAQTRAWQRTMYEQIDEMDNLGLKEMPFDESKIEIKNEDRDYDYLAIMLETIPSLRNHYAHGSSSLHNQVIGSIQVVAEIINQIFPHDKKLKGSE